MIDLEQMHKDMEAGTQGDWTADFDGEDDFDGVSIQSDFRGWNFEPIARCPVDFTDRCQRLADVRRIARVPQLEREYIALREAADAADDLISAVDSGYPIWGSFAEGLLEVYKEAKLKATK